MSAEVQIRQLRERLPFTCSSLGVSWSLDRETGKHVGRVTEWARTTYLLDTASGQSRADIRVDRVEILVWPVNPETGENVTFVGTWCLDHFIEVKMSYINDGVVIDAMCFVGGRTFAMPTAARCIRHRADRDVVLREGGLLTLSLEVSSPVSLAVLHKSPITVVVHGTADRRVS